MYGKMCRHFLFLIVVVLWLFLFSSGRAFTDECCVGGTCGILADGFCYVTVSSNPFDSWHQSRTNCKALFHPASDLAIPRGSDSYFYLFGFAFDGPGDLWMGASNLQGEVEYLTGELVYAEHQYVDSVIPEPFVRPHCVYLADNYGQMVYREHRCTDVTDGYSTYRGKYHMCMIDMAEVNETLGSALYPGFNRQFHSSNGIPIRPFCDFTVTPYCPEDTLCPNNCSGHGTCEYSTELPGAVCSCEGLYMGADCSRISDCEIPRGEEEPVKGIQLGDYCYFQPEDREYKTWEIGRDLCKSIEVASDFPVFHDIGSEIEEQFIAEIFGDGYWLGLHNILREPWGDKDWMWIDGIEMSDGDRQETYDTETWVSGNRLCMAHWGNIGSGWLTRACSDTISLGMTVCRVLTTEMGALAASEQWLNVRYLFGPSGSYCDIDRFGLSCPTEFFCGGITNPALWCGGVGTCLFHPGFKESYCDCPMPFQGDDCLEPAWCNGFYFDGYCYFYVNGAYTFSEYRNECKFIYSGADLVYTLRDDKTIEWWYDEIDDSIFLGAIDEFSEGNWVWLDGTPVDFTLDSMEWVYIDYDNPSSNCLYIWYDEWIDERCEMQDSYAYCVIDVKDYGFSGSVEHPWLNVRYAGLDDSSPVTPYCDVDLYQCPDQFWCQGTPGRVGCSNNGDCRFNHGSLSPYCECDLGSFGDICQHTAPECTIKGTPGREWEDVCYVRISGSIEEWQSARDACKAWVPESDLPILQTASSNEFFLGVFGIEFWLGATDLLVEGQWYWVDGNPVSSSGWTGWTPWEPDNMDGGQHCLFLDEDMPPEDFLSWKDKECYHAESFVCAVDLLPMTSHEIAWKNVSYDHFKRKAFCDFETLTCPSDPMFGCAPDCLNCTFDAVKGPVCNCAVNDTNSECLGPPEWCSGPSDLYYGGYCFSQRTTEMLTWHDARTYCKENWHLAADLPVGNTPDLMAFLDDTFAGSLYWIGGNDLVEESVYEWITGEMVTPSSGLSISSQNNPSDCLYARSNSYWDVRSCQAKMPFVCALHIDDYETVNGSVVEPETNVRFHSIVQSIDPWGYPVWDQFGFRYCDFSKVDCPGTEYFCSRNPDLSGGCSHHGMCYFDELTLSPKCECHASWGGEDCSIPEIACEVLGVPGVRLGDDCYVKITNSTLNWFEARTECKTWHSAADLPVVDTPIVQNFLRGHFDMQHWIGLSTVQHFNVFEWVDGSQLVDTYNARPEGLEIVHMYYYECGVLGNRIHTPPEGWSDLPCPAVAAVVCVVDVVADLDRAVDGATNPFKNVFYEWGYVDDNMIWTYPFCHSDEFDCPEEFSCRNDCHGHGSCLTDDYPQSPYCECDAGYFGNDCARPSWCDGLYYDGVCYWVPESMLHTIEDARATCKSLHPAADLPFINTINLFYELVTHFDLSFQNSRIAVGITSMITGGSSLDPLSWTWYDGSPLRFLSPLVSQIPYCPEGLLDDECLFISWDGVYDIIHNGECSQEYETICALRVEDFEHGDVHGSITSPWLNVVYEGLQNNPRMYCDFDGTLCPEDPRFFCGGYPDGCSSHSHCEFISKTDTCVCDPGWFGPNCDEQHETCLIEGQAGYTFQNRCYIPISDEEVTLPEALEACKEFHSAAVLPFMIDSEIDFLLELYSGMETWWIMVSSFPIPGEFALLFGMGGPLPPPGLLPNWASSYPMDPSEFHCVYSDATDGGDWKNDYCHSKHRFMCMVDVADIGRTLEGSLEPEWNYRLDFLYDDEDIPVALYCNPLLYACGGFFNCSQCTSHGTCVFDEELLTAGCYCDVNWAGEHCEQPAKNCTIGDYVGWEVDGACIFQVNEDKLTWSDARKSCKAAYSAADIVVVYTDMQWNYVIHFGGGQWMGLSKMLGEPGEWTSVDGVPGAGGVWIPEEGDCLAIDLPWMHMMHLESLQGRPCADPNVTLSSLCAVNLTIDLNRAEGGSTNPLRNVMYDFENDHLYCDFHQYICPSEFWCNGIEHDRLGCDDIGNCTFDAVAHVSYCECDNPLMGGTDCSVPIWCPGLFLNGSCFLQPSSPPLNWVSARAACKDWHNAADLVVVDVDEKRQFLKDEFGAGIWVGATDARGEGTWEWVTHEPFLVPGLLVEDGGDMANCLYLDPSGTEFNDLSCASELLFVCAVDEEDWDQTTGSKKLWSNVRYFGIDETDGYPLHPYCDFVNFDCPDEFWCSATPGLRAGCSGEGDCFFDWNEFAPRCDCDDGYTGEDCSIDEVSCEVTGIDEMLSGLLFDGACYLVVDPLETTWMNARDLCKSWHAAADLPVVTPTNEEFLMTTYGTGYWMGITTLLSGSWTWLDGFPEVGDFAVESGECARIFYELHNPPYGLVNDYCDHPASVAKFVCAVEVIDYGNSVFGATNPEKNVRFDDGLMKPFCDVEQYECPIEFRCPDDCSENGICNFDVLILEPYCECDLGWTGPNCGIPGECPGVHFDGVCYYPPLGGPLTWNEARTMCKATLGLAADLAVPIPNATNALRSTFSNVETFWLGATDAVEEGVWNWISNEPLVPLLGQGVTLNLTNAEDSDCLLWTNGGDVWTDVSCTSRQRFICALRDDDFDSTRGSSVAKYLNVRYDSIGEDDGIPATPYCDLDILDCPTEFLCGAVENGCQSDGNCRFDPLTLSPVCDCPIGFSPPLCEESFTPCFVGGFSGIPFPPGSVGSAVERCFVVPEGDRRSALTEDLNWAQSRDFCKNWHSASDLPMARDAEELAFLLETFGVGIWLGMTDILTAGDWMWNDGMPVSLSNWDGSIPSQEGEHRCGALWSAVNGFVALSCLGDTARTVCVVDEPDFDRDEEGSLQEYRNVRYDFHNARAYCDIISFSECPDEFYCDHLQDCHADSGNGLCVFDPVNDRVKCECNEEWTGPYCSLNTNSTGCRDIHDLGKLTAPPAVLHELNGFNGVFQIKLSNPKDSQLPLQVLVVGEMG